MKFFLRYKYSDEVEETEVTKEQYVQAERSAGFRPKCHDIGHPATAGFNTSFVSGSVKYDETDN